MTDSIIAAAIIIIVVGLATLYIIKAKKNGQKCIGCPHAKSCGKNCTCNIDRTTDEK